MISLVISDLVGRDIFKNYLDGFLFVKNRYTNVVLGNWHVF